LLPEPGVLAADRWRHAAPTQLILFDDARR
jgi:hypothetical protein